MIETLDKASGEKTPRAERHPKGGGGQKARVVSYYLRGSNQKAVKGQLTSPQLIAALNAGLPVGELDELQAALDVPMDTLAGMLGISKATFHRRQARGRLDAVESDRALRYARLTGKAIEVMETEAGAREWLNTPQIGLGGAVPLEYAKTEIGAREVENLLGRIEYGVYS